MPFTVVHPTRMTKDPEYREYLRLLTRILLQQGVNLTDVPRIEEPGSSHRWLYVWPTTQEAQDFAELLKKKTESDDWVVREVSVPPSHGPLRPLEVQVGRHPHGWTFALAPWARWAVQMQLPRSCQSDTVSIAARVNGDFAAAQGGLDHLARQMLFLLTGLSAEQLQAFETFVLTDPVTAEVVLPPSPIES